MRALDPEALIQAARRRQRRRRALVTLSVLVAAGVAVAVDSAIPDGNPSANGRGMLGPGASSTTLRLVLRGFGTPLSTQIDRGECPQGRTLIPVRSSSGRPIGSALACVRTIRQERDANGAITSIGQTVRETYRLIGGTITTRERQTVRFASDRAHSSTSVRGTITGGTGRYAGVRGTIGGGGRGLDGEADWRVRLDLGPPDDQRFRKSAS